MDSNVLFYLICAVLICGIIYSYAVLRKGRGDDYVYIVRKDKKHYFSDYNSAKKFGSGVRMIPKSSARSRGMVLYRGGRK